MLQNHCMKLEWCESLHAALNMKILSIAGRDFHAQHADVFDKKLCKISLSAQDAGEVLHLLLVVQAVSGGPAGQSTTALICSRAQHNLVVTMSPELYNLQLSVSIPNTES